MRISRAIMHRACDTPRRARKQPDASLRNRQKRKLIGRSPFFPELSANSAVVIARRECPRHFVFVGIPNLYKKKRIKKKKERSPRVYRRRKVFFYSLGIIFIPRSKPSNFRGGHFSFISDNSRDRTNNDCRLSSLPRPPCLLFLLPRVPNSHILTEQKSAPGISFIRTPQNTAESFIKLEKRARTFLDKRGTAARTRARVS